jgi:hypothetical protein
METLHTIARISGKRRAVFRVPTVTRGHVFMSVADPSVRKAVVEVDATRFLELWRQPYSSHPEVAHLGPKDWPSDYKFRHAEAGFAEGEWNPVPLASVSCGVYVEQVKIVRSYYLGIRKNVEWREGPPSNLLGFTNGITRTIWLLTAGVRVFPVECGAEDAALLQRLAGLPGSVPRTVADLLPEPTDAQYFEELRADEERIRQRYAIR